MKDEQVRELLYQMLETELGGVEVYTTAIECAENEDLKEEWEEYLEQTQNHVAVVEETIRKLGLDPEEETPGRKVVRHIGESLVEAMEMALSEGSSPFLAMPKTLMVSVCDSGPVVKSVTMYSSSERVNAISAPEMIVGRGYGTMTSQKAFSGGAPRSMAASSRKGSTPASRAWTATRTNGKQKVVWAMMTVV